MAYMLSNCTFCRKHRDCFRVHICSRCYDSGTGTKLFEFEIRELRNKVEFLERFVSRLREETPPDIYLKSGDDQPCLPAHAIMLAARSEVLKNVVGADDAFKSAANHKTVLTFSELNGEELESLVEFLYTGSLSKKLMDKHAYSLLIAADKYDIPYLLQVCQTHILQLVVPDNMRYLLHDKCMNFLRENMTSRCVLSSNSPPQSLEVLMRTYVSGASGLYMI